MTHLKDLEETIHDMKASSSLVEKERFIRTLRKMTYKALHDGEIQLANKIAAAAKSFKIPCEGLDLLRSLAFIKSKDYLSAYEAIKEEIRYFPHNSQAVKILDELTSTIGGTPHIINDENFNMLYKLIYPYTMCGAHRLYCLYTHANAICQNGPSGSFVECGVAGGGSSGLLAYTLKQYSNSSEQKLFCCDSFEGMPPASEYDVHNGVNAEDTGWGNGTCSAPETSVQKLCEILHAADKIEIVKGYFEDTLPIWKEKFGRISFLHMDGDWYSSTKAILENLYDSLVPNAYVQIDDYGHWDGCRKAVDEFFKSRQLTVKLNNIDGTGAYFIK